MLRLFVKTKTKTKTLFFVLEAPGDQDFGLEDYITELFARISREPAERNCRRKWVL